MRKTRRFRHYVFGGHNRLLGERTWTVQPSTQRMKRQAVVADAFWLMPILDRYGEPVCHADSQLPKSMLRIPLKWGTDSGEVGQRRREATLVTAMISEVPHMSQDIYCW